MYSFWFQGPFSHFSPVRCRQRECCTTLLLLGTHPSLTISNLTISKLSGWIWMSTVDRHVLLVAVGSKMLGLEDCWAWPLGPVLCSTGFKGASLGLFGLTFSILGLYKHCTMKGSMEQVDILGSVFFNHCLCGRVSSRTRWSPYQGLSCVVMKHAPVFPHFWPGHSSTDVSLG